MTAYGQNQQPPAPPSPRPFPYSGEPAPRKRPKAGRIIGLILLALSLLVGLFTIWLTMLLFQVGITTDVGDDGQAKLDAGSYEILEPTQADALQIIIADESGRVIEVEEETGDYYEEYDESRIIFSVEEDGLMTFDSDGQPVKVKEYRGYNALAGLMLVIIVVGFIAFLILLLAGATTLAVNYRNRRLASR